MAKIAFGKLGLAKNTAVTSIKHNELMIEVKNYLPVNEKLELISNVINYSVDTTEFANPIKVTVYATLEIVEAYTNLSFTDKQKEDPCKLYDLLVGSGLSSKIMAAIPTVELAELLTGIEDSIKSFYDFQTSFVGMLSTIQSDYSNLSLDADAIKEKIGNPENLKLLREVLTKLG